MQVLNMLFFSNTFAYLLLQVIQVFLLIFGFVNPVKTKKKKGLSGWLLLRAYWECAAPPGSDLFFSKAVSWHGIAFSSLTIPWSQSKMKRCSQTTHLTIKHWVGCLLSWAKVLYDSGFSLPCISSSLIYIKKKERETKPFQPLCTLDYYLSTVFWH